MGKNFISTSVCVTREFEALYQDREHVEVAHKAAQEASRQAMANPRRFSKPSVLSALATAMAPSLSIAIRYMGDHIPVYYASISSQNTMLRSLVIFNQFS